MSAALTIIVALALWTGPADPPAPDPEEPRQEALEPKEDVQETIDAYLRGDPGISKFFDNAAGYAVFPHVGKGAFIIGGAHGEGELIVKGRGAIGEASLTQVTYGLQVGGQDYNEIIFFESPVDVERFKDGGLELSAQVSVVVVTLGAADGADYKDGVAVFTHTKAGLMYEASVGGQGFDFDPY